MSGFIDFVVADESEHPTVLAASDPGDRWPRFEWKWLGPVELAGAYAVLTCDTSDENRKRLNDEFEMLGMEEVEDPEEFGASVYRFPARLLEMLAAFGDADIERVANEWATWYQSKGWSGFEKDPEWNRKVLDGLSRLAKQARATGKTILIRDAGAY
jgi:hypothetical protein